MSDQASMTDRATFTDQPQPNLPLLRKVRRIGMTERFWEQVEVSPTGCVVFTGRSDRGGYGIFRGPDGRQGLVHRFMFREFVGALPASPTLDHLCGITACFNPDHLVGATHRANILRSSGPAAANASKVQCPFGHEYTAENTYLVRAGRSRRCKRCALDAQRRRRGLVSA